MIKPLEPHAGWTDDENAVSLDELNALMAQASHLHNTAPDPELGGLSPEQMYTLLYTPWDAPQSPVQFNSEIPLDQLESQSPLFKLGRWLLCTIHEAGGVKGTAGKNLPRSLVTASLDYMPPSMQVERLREICKVFNEEDLGPLHIARITARQGNLLQFSKGRFTVPRKAVALLTPDKAGELFARLFTTHFQKINLAYPSEIGPPCAELQMAVPYTLQRLGEVLTDWQPEEGLAARLLPPAMLAGIEAATEGLPYWNADSLLASRILFWLVQWGLLEERTDPDQPRNLSPDLRVSPLYRNLLRFEWA